MVVILCQKARLIISFFFLECTLYVHTIVMPFIVLCHIRQKMSNMSPFRLFVRLEDYWRYKQKTKYTNLSAFCFDFFMTHPSMKYTNKSLSKYWKKSFEQINEWVETLQNWFCNKLRHAEVRLGQQNILYVWLFQ